MNRLTFWRAQYKPAQTFYTICRNFTWADCLPAVPDRHYLRNQSQELSRLNELLFRKAVSFEERLCCNKTSKALKTITAHKPNYFCKRYPCRIQ